MKLFATEVFTPNGFPTHTYVARDEERLEQKLRDALRTPKMVVSISGPSKSGKTVLVGKVVGSENIIPVSGIELKTADDLPLMALSWMDAPTTTSVEDGTTTDNTVGGEASGQGAFLFGKVEGKANYQRKKSKAQTRSETFTGGGLAKLPIALSPFFWTTFITSLMKFRQT